MSDDKTTYKYSIRVEYVGKNYGGSQIQPNNNTVQEELEKALSTLINGVDKDSSKNSEHKKKPIKAIFSGRTDKGVNSKGQIVHFETDKKIVASRFIYSLNEILPDDISVDELKEVDKKFHAQKSAKRRYYRYVLWNKHVRSAFDGDLICIRPELNIERMQKALEYLLGEHDFSAFKGSGSKNPDTICSIYNVGCKKLDGMVIIDIVGNRFLYNMVRAIVGTLLLIERKNLSAEFMKEILEGKDRTKAGRTVNPHGLTLMKVEY